jgi:hypothetical protein
MPPRRNAEELLALANDPAAGWAMTPVAKRSAHGTLVGSYLSAYLQHHRMPTTKDEMDRMHGGRLWKSKLKLVPAEHRDGSDVAPGGLLHLVRTFNHGFKAPVQAQGAFLSFLQSLPASTYAFAAGHAADLPGHLQGRECGEGLAHGPAGGAHQRQRRAPLLAGADAANVGLSQRSERRRGVVGDVQG